MFIDQWARVIGKAQHIPRVAHGQRERAGFRPAQAAEIDRHEKRGHLVVQYLAGRVGGDDLFDLGRLERMPVTLGLDKGKEIHLPKVAKARPKAMQKTAVLPYKLLRRS